MANPNLLSATTISGITTFLELSTSSQTLVTNAAASGKVMRIGGVTVANIDGTNAADVTVKIHNAAAGAGTSFSLFQTISVPGDSSITLVDKNNVVYVGENQSFTAEASAASDLNIIVSYEEIS